MLCGDRTVTLLTLALLQRVDRGGLTYRRAAWKVMSRGSRIICARGHQDVHLGFRLVEDWEDPLTRIDPDKASMADSVLGVLLKYLAAKLAGDVLIHIDGEDWTVTVEHIDETSLRFRATNGTRDLFLDLAFEGAIAYPED